MTFEVKHFIVKNVRLQTLYIEYKVIESVTGQLSNFNNISFSGEGKTNRNEQRHKT